MRLTFFFPRPPSRRGEAYLSLEVGFLWGGQDVCRGDVEVQQDLSERWPVPRLGAPVEDGEGLLVRDTTRTSEQRSSYKYNDPLLRMVH